MSATHKILGGKVQLFRRAGSPFWNCSGTVAGRQFRTSTKQESLERAKEFAEDWYLEMRGKARWGDGLPRGGPPFKKAADKFLEEYEIITLGERNAHYVEGHKTRVRLHLMPFFGGKALSEITPGLVQEYRQRRLTPPPPSAEPEIILDKNGKEKRRPAWRRPARNTLHQEIVTLRQILKTAQRHGWLESIPNLSPPYRASVKISHRAWFSHAEYDQLCKAVQDNIKDPPRSNWRESYEVLYDFIIFMANTGLRPDEAYRLEYRDITVVKDQATGERILEIEVRGKRGVGHCKSMPAACYPFWRMKKRFDGQPTDRIFGKFPRQCWTNLLNREGLKKDRDGNARTPYSLRHTYICFRLMQGADIYQIAKNCRTSVEMIEKHYAAHLKNTLDASAINVRKAKPEPRASEPNIRASEPKSRASVTKPRASEPRQGKRLAHSSSRP